MKFTKGPSASAPSSALGIMRFFDIDTGGPNITPEFIFIVTGLFIVVELVLHFLG